MGDLKSKAVNSTIWSLFETFGNQGLQFIIGIILARLLLPEDYGLIGVLAIFMGIAGVLVDSGFKTSIIRSQDLTDIDCSTIFYVNLLVSFLVALLLFLLAPSISIYFGKPDLINITRAFALIPIINGFGLVQSSLLFKNLQFKRNAIISIISNLISGGIAIILAIKGFSYWALVWRAILVASIYNILLWIFSCWRPQIAFSLEILGKHFRFSSRLLLTGILDSFFENLYSLIFGKFFSFKELGFFTRGKGYVDIVSKTLSSAIQKVNTPLIAASAKTRESIFVAYVKLLKLTSFLVFPATAFLIAAAKPMIIFLIGDKWLPAVPFLQILAIAGISYPLTNANSSLLEVQGYSNKILKIALLSRPIQLIILFITMQFGSYTVAFGIVLHQIILAIISFMFIKELTNNGIAEIFRSLVPSIIISLILGIFVYIIGFFFNRVLTSGILLCIQILTSFSILILTLKVLRNTELSYITKLIINKIHRS